MNQTLFFHPPIPHQLPPNPPLQSDLPEPKPTARYLHSILNATLSQALHPDLRTAQPYLRNETLCLLVIQTV